MWFTPALLFRSLDITAVLCMLLFDTLNLSSSSPAQTDYSHTKQADTDIVSCTFILKFSTGSGKKIFLLHSLH